MSYYDSESEIYEDEQNKHKELFSYDTSLLRAVQMINNWKQNIGLPILEYLQKQAPFVQKEYQMLQCGAQVRALAFCRSLDKGLHQLIDKYSQAYSKALDSTFDLTTSIQRLDQQLKLLVKYLHVVQANNILNMYSELYDQSIGVIYINLRKIVDYCFDLNTLWLTLLTPKMFREEQKDNLYKVNYGGTLMYYQKQILYLLDRIKRADIKNFSVFPKSPAQLLHSIALIVNNQKLKPNLKTKIISLLKGQYYASMPNKSLKDNFILSSLQMYHGEEVSELWDYERYEDLCIKALRQSFVDKEYIECTLYMEPQNIDFQRRTKTLELAQIYYAIIQKILSLSNQSKLNQNKQSGIVEVPLHFIKNIMSHHNIQLVGHLFVNFLISNKNALSMNSPQLDKLLFGIIDDLKKIFLSFGSDYWCVPSAFLLAVTNRFFGKFSQDIKNQIVALLPVMVKHIGEDRIPIIPEIVQQNLDGQKQYKCVQAKIPRAEQLMAIFCYIRDAEYKDQDFYLDLPQVTPTNFQTAVMFIRSLELKLRHHQPTQDKKKLWIMIIEESVFEYKIKVDLKWFKPKRRLDVEEREGQFLIHKQIKQKWAFDLVQQALNYRDQTKYDQLVNNGVEGEVSIEGDLIIYFKYAVGININASRWSSYIQDYELFSLLQRMRSLLDINFGDIVHLTPDQLVTLNQLHLCLMFYNTKIQRAKGNEVYTLIAYKIIIPWIQSTDKKACDQFQEKFHQFFISFIFQEYYLSIGDAIVSCLSNSNEKDDSIRNKIVFYMENLPKDIVIATSIDSNAQLLQKIYSVLNDQINVDTLIASFLLVYRFIQYVPQLEDQYVTLGFFIDFVREPKKFSQFLQKSQELGNREKSKINLQIVKKLPQIFDNLTIQQINQILKTFFSTSENKSEFILSILDQIPKQKQNLTIAILKTLIAEKNMQEKVQKLKNNPNAQKQQSEKVWKYWSQLEKYVDDNCVQRKKDEQQVNLANITQIFEENALKKLKQDYRKLLQQLNKKKSSKKKSQKKEQNLSHDANDKYKQAKIWRKVVKNFGTFQDVILFGQDPLQVGNSFQNQIYENCLKVIQERNIQQKYLKRIIRKLPILQKCAEDTIKKINQEGTQIQQNVQPELLCKLIMINSRYKSNIIQQFILKNIHKIPIPIRIYQDYLALQIKKKLQNLPKDIVSKMLYDDLGEANSRKIDQLFDLLVYLPIKKFQHIYLKFQNKIQQKQEGQNEEWQTQSEKDQQDDEQEEETNLQKKKSKKKSSKQERNQQKLQQDQQEENDEGMNSQNADEYDQQQFSEQVDDSIQDQQNVQKSRIVDMFYEEHNKDLPKYKQLIKLRQEINISLSQDYLKLQKLETKIKQDPQLEKKVFKVVDILENQISEAEIVTQILNKMPDSFYQILKKFGLTKEKNQASVDKYRKQMVKMPRFIKDYMSDRDENSENHDQEGYEDQIYDEDDDLSEESNSIDDLEGINDGLFFIVSEDGQLSQINADELLKNEGEQSQQQQERESQQIQIEEKLSKDADEALSLPQLKQINSKIESQLTGKQLGQEEMVKILEIAIIKLFSLSTYQLKHKPVLEFYKQLIISKQGKIFVDTLLTVLRIDELYEDKQRFQLAKKLNRTQLALSKALGNFLEIAYDISTQQSKESKEISKLIRDEVRELLPIGDQIMIKSNIPVQDNYLTLLVFYSRYSQRSVHDKLKKLLSSLNEEQKNPYELNRAKASLLTKHIYKNSNSSSIWNNIEERFGVNIQMKTKFSSCLVVYGRMLREDIENCYNDLLEIVKQKQMHENQTQDKQKQRQILKQQQKKVEQNLRKHFKRIKHYYYWNKRNIISQLDKLEVKPIKLLKNKELIKLTELMIFYCHFIKQQFFQKIDPKALRNLLVLPKSVIETSFMFLWKLQANIEKWQPLNKVKQYFKGYKLYEHQFDRLQQVCNLILQFLEMPQFSNSKFKQVIIPYFINHPEIAHEIPLIFKIPDIPQQLNGQKVYLTRECSFDMAFYQWMTSSFLVEFHNQQGSDHGGMVRELMMGWTGMGIGEEHIFIGKILAFSFKKSIPYGGKFDLGMAIAITQFKVTIEFLEQVDPQICQSLKYIRDSDPQDLDIKFEITKQQFGVVKHYPLIPGGQDVTVTNENKQKYLDLFMNNYYLVGREWEMSELCTGFFSIVNKKYAAIFNPLQMMQKIQGEQINDYTKLKIRTKYEEGYTESSQMIKWFWQIVAEFNQKQMNRFLQFITGAPKVSIFNHNFTFVIEKPYGQDDSRLPVAHTCFNTLELPEYKTKQILQKKLHQAIFEGNDNFGIL